ncbi:uncharacterized protein [Nicotiana tomentosiformis]|uniref:uncharacterized protein n=1 Tax=Nicotiana tomentosiformis TaxID=4098 RepID=UPI00388C3ED4
MVGDEDNVDLAIREAAQQREKVARDAEETALRNAQLVYEEERARRIAQNRPVGAYQFGNIAPGVGRPLGDYARPDFWDGLIPTSRRILSNAAGGPLMKKTPEEIVTILDALSEDANKWPSEVAERRRTTGVHQVDANTSVQVQLDAMAKEIRNLTLASIHSDPPAVCDICERGYPTHECQASIEEVNIVDNYNFNAMGQKHPSFSWSSPGGTANAWQQNNSRFQGAPGLRSLEIQVGQIATILSERIPGTLPANTEKNSKETVNVVTLRSRQVLKYPTPIQKEVAPQKESGKELKIEADDKKTEKKKGKKGAGKKKRKRRKLQEVLSQMPTYAKLLKEIFTKKRKIEETSVVKLTEHCSAILQNKLPQKKLEKEIGEIRSVPIYLQLADQTTITSEGIVEDVLVRVDKFVFPIDFIVVNMEENKVGEETVTFEMNVATGVKRKKPAANVEWKLKSSKEKDPVI